MLGYMSGATMSAAPTGVPGFGFGQPFGQGYHGGYGPAEPSFGLNTPAGCSIGCDGRTAMALGQPYDAGNAFGMFNTLPQHLPVSSQPQFGNIPQYRGAYATNAVSTYPWGQPINALNPQAINHRFTQPSAFAGGFGTFPYTAQTLATQPFAAHMPQQFWQNGLTSEVPNFAGQVPFGFGQQAPAWARDLTASVAPQAQPSREQTSQPLSGRLPAINIWEDDANLTIEAEVPGVSLDDVDLQIAGRTLHLRTGRLLAGSQADQQRRMIHGERVPGGFSRVIHLPTEIDGEKVDAKLSNGVLRLTLPKLNAQQRRTIRVNQVANA